MPFQTPPQACKAVNRLTETLKARTCTQRTTKGNAQPEKKPYACVHKYTNTLTHTHHFTTLFYTINIKGGLAHVNTEREWEKRCEEMRQKKRLEVEVNAKEHLHFPPFLSFSSLSNGPYFLCSWLVKARQSNPFRLHP